MTMCSPEGYMDNLRNEPYEVLIKERNNLLKEIRYFEKNKDELMQENECSVTPSMHYYWNLCALATLFRIMADRCIDDDEQEE